MHVTRLELLREKYALRCDKNGGVSIMTATDLNEEGWF